MSLNKLCTIALFTAILSAFLSCEKPEPNPYSMPGVVTSANYKPPIDTTAAFMASVNSGSLENFTPSKMTMGSNITLTGTNANYTITITFPIVWKPELYWDGITATCVSGSETYVWNNESGNGNLTIESISPKGNYYGTFQFDAAYSYSGPSIQCQGYFNNL